MAGGLQKKREMKNRFRNSVVRALSALVLGGLLVGVAGRMPVWLVMACGVIFIVPGAVGLVAWWMRDTAARGTLLSPVAGLGSILMGVILLLFPESFVSALMYLLSAFLLLLSFLQMYTLFTARRAGAHLSWWYFVAPVAVLLAGLYVLLFPEQTAAMPFIVIGAAALFYGMMELWFTLLVYLHHRCVRKAQKAEAEAQAAREVAELPVVEVESAEVIPASSESQD